jgi:hypothetical protein
MIKAINPKRAGHQGCIPVNASLAGDKTMSERRATPYSRKNFDALGLVRSSIFSV